MSVHGAESAIEISSPSVAGSAAEARLEAQLLESGRPPVTLFFETDFSAVEDPAAMIRPFVLAALPIAMRRGKALAIPHALDSACYRNLMEWQQAMALWHPGELSSVPLSVRVEPARAAAGGSRKPAATAFSGGVDSCYTAVRYSQHDEFKRRLPEPLAAGIMIHGLDIPLTETGHRHFDRAFARSRAILSSHGLDALSVKTNVRDACEAEGVNWGTASHGALIAAALACFESRFATLLIPSTYVYHHLKTPWASNPITDPLFSSAQAQYIHDGAGANKLDKVRAIAGDPAVRRSLRVCWEGPEQDQNCGHCFKCVATQACFWIAGVDSLDAFPSPATLEELARVPLTNAQNRYLFGYMRDRAKAQQQHDVASSLGHAIMRARLRVPKRGMRKKLKKIIHAFKN